MLFAKILLVALSLLLQNKIFREDSNTVLNELDTLTLPSDHPEWALARRAFAANGLSQTPCPPLFDKDGIDTTFGNPGIKQEERNLAVLCY
jgi:hypothetical protein